MLFIIFSILVCFVFMILFSGNNTSDGRSACQTANPIEFIGIPVYIVQKYLKRLLASIDYPIGHLVIVVNSLEDEEMNEYVRSLEEPFENNPLHKFVSKLTVIYNDNNLGVAAAWNQIVDVGIAHSTKYFFILGSDSEFYPHSLRTIASYLSDEKFTRGFDMFEPYVCCQLNMTLYNGFFASHLKERFTDSWKIR